MTGERVAKEPIFFPSRPRTTPIATQQEKDRGIDPPRSFFLDANKQCRLEVRVFETVIALEVSARIAHHPTPTGLVIERGMRVAMYPEVHSLEEFGR